MTPRRGADGADDGGRPGGDPPPRPVPNEPEPWTSEDWEHWDRVYSAALGAATQAAATPQPPPPPDPFVDWAHLWADEGQGDWLYDDVLALGRGHALYASHKVGKSLFMLWVAAQLTTRREDVLVVYLDYEMTEDDLRERLEDMGHGPDSDLSRLRYALLPSLPPLNSPEGGQALCTLIDQALDPYKITEGADGPQLATDLPHVLVVIDTTSRAVTGEENDSGPYRDFARHTGLRLKQRGHTFARLDHAGKDPTKGQRGSSAKGDDIDLAWKIAKTEEGMELRRDLSRIAWAPAKVPFRIRTDPHLTYEPVGVSVPTGTAEMVTRLDRLGVPLDATTTQAQHALRSDGGKGARRAVVLAALRSRQERAHPARK